MTQTALQPPPGSKVEAPPRNLIQKAAAVMGVIEHVPKNGRNSFHGYDYATEADIVAAVRKEMAKQGLMLIPAVDKVEWSKVQTKSGEERLCTLTVKFTLTDGTESREVVVLGEGQDRGDKASYKALTGALKYALLKLFLIPTGDDPELDDEKPARGKQDKPAPKGESKPEPILAARVQAIVAGMTKLGFKSSDARLAKAKAILHHDFNTHSPDDVNALETWLKGETNVETAAQVLGATRDGVNPAA